MRTRNGVTDAGDRGAPGHGAYTVTGRRPCVSLYSSKFVAPVARAARGVYLSSCAIPITRAAPAVHRGHIGARSAGAPGRAIGVRAPPALRRGVCPGTATNGGRSPRRTRPTRARMKDSTTQSTEGRWVSTSPFICPQASPIAHSYVVERPAYPYGSSPRLGLFSRRNLRLDYLPHVCLMVL